MPKPDECRDRDGRTFSQYVSDHVMSAIASKGMSVRQVAAAAGLNRTTLQDRLHDHRPFTTSELALIARVLGLHPAELVDLDGFNIDHDDD